MSTANQRSTHKPDPAIQINSLLSCANDCMERAGGGLDPQAFDALIAAYVDQQLYRAIVYISKARAIAINTHGISDLIPACDGGDWHADDVVELAPVCSTTGEKGGGK